MSAVDKIGTLAEVVINEQQFSDQRGAMFKLSDAIESQIASTTSTDFTHLSTSTTSFTNDISSLQNLRNSNFITKKKAWDATEDEILTSLVERFGTQTWTEIAQRLPNRSGKQCRERWHNHLDPGIRKGEWSEEEDRIIVQMQQIYGNQWAKITKCLPGRTDNAVKNRFHAVERARLRNDRMVTPEVYPIYFLKKRKLNQDPEDAQAFQYLRALGRMGYMAGPGLAALGAGGPESMSALNHMAATLPAIPLSAITHLDATIMNPETDSVDQSTNE